MRRVETGADCRARENHRGGLRPVAARARELETEVAKRGRRPRRVRHCAGFPFRAGQGQHRLRVVAWRLAAEPGFGGDILLHAKREDGHHPVPHPFLGEFGGELQVGGALGEHLDEGVTAPLGLQPQRLFDRAPRPHPLLRVEQGDALDVHGPVELRDQLGDAQRPARRKVAPLGLVVVLWPCSVVGANWPPVIP